MAISTYAQLQTAVANWLTRSDLTDRAPEFIALAEGELNRLLNVRQMYARTAAFAIDAATESVPTGFAGVRAFHLNTAPVEPLVFVRPDEFDDPRESAVEGQGRPRRYTLIGSDFLFSPTPDAAYTATLAYRKKLTPLSDAATSNWLLEDAPDVYLNGALTYGYQYLEDPDSEAKHRALFFQAIDELNGHDSRHSYGSSPSRRVRGFG